jgi:hypothetical protein
VLVGQDVGDTRENTAPPPHEQSIFRWPITTAGLAVDGSGSLEGEPDALLMAH